MQVTVDIPDQFADSLVPEGRDASRLLLEEAAAGAYRQGRLTVEQIRVLLGYGTSMQVFTFLGQHEIEVFPLEEFEKDVATMERLFPSRQKLNAA